MTTTCSDLDLETLLDDVESDLVERKAAFDGDAPRAVPVRTRGPTAT